MSKGLLTLFSGATVLLLLFASAPAEADVYRSNLVCSTNFGGLPAPIAASGFTVIQDDGDLYVSIGDLDVPRDTRFSCTIFCPLTGTHAKDSGSFPKFSCGDRLSTNGRDYTTISPRLAKDPPLSHLCAEPSVEVIEEPFGSGFNKVFCESGFVTPKR